MGLFQDSKNEITHDPGPQEAARRAAVSQGNLQPIVIAGGGRVLVGTAGWTDPSLTARGVFYPAGIDSAEDRLRYYASLFPLVEVDSTYYALPTRRNAELWVERTPAGFMFDLKAHALMTGQPTEVNRLPQAIRERLAAEAKGQDRIYGKDLTPDLYDRMWSIFLDALEPLQQAGKLGSILLQYPRWFYPSASNRETILDTQRRLHGIRCSVEFRNSAWFNDKNTEKTLEFLQEHTIPFVMVDEPQGTKSSIPPLVAVTSPDLAVIRFHGRRTETWEARGAGVSERFRYFYNREELSEWIPCILQSASQTQEVHIIMNNCYANYGTTNAQELMELIRKSVDVNQSMGF